MFKKLSLRLQRIADEITPGCSFADIGSDHALLPVYVAQHKLVQRAIATELNAGPLEQAQRQVRASGLTHMIDVRGGNGLEVLQVNEVDVISIAGMGGSLISTILEQGKDKLRGVHKLILQPNVGEEHVRRWLVQEGWFLTHEIILEEDNHIYEILVAIACEDAGMRNEQLYQERMLSNGRVCSSKGMYLLGPYLMNEAADIWARKWHFELIGLRNILHQLSYSQTEDSIQRSVGIQQQITMIQEVLTCTQMDIPLSNGSNA